MNERSPRSKVSRPAEEPGPRRAPEAVPRARGSAGAPRSESAGPTAAAGSFDLFADAVGAGVHAGGRPLTGDLRGRAESTLGVGLGDVRLHDGPDSHAAAASYGARAFALGNDIHFAAGAFDPGSEQGDALIAHEVVHTVQQGGRAAGPQMKLEVGRTGDAWEREADAGAARILGGGGPMTVTPAPAMIARHDPRDPHAPDGMPELRLAIAQAHTEPAFAAIQTALAHPTAGTHGRVSIPFGDDPPVIQRAQINTLLEELTRARSALGAATVRAAIARVHDGAAAASLMSALAGGVRHGARRGQFLVTVTLPSGGTAEVAPDEIATLQREVLAATPTSAPDAPALEAPDPSYAHATSATPADDATLTALAAARSDVHVTPTLTETIEYLNPTILRMLPVTRGGGARRRIFGELTAALRRQYEAMHTVSELRAATRLRADDAADLASALGTLEEVRAEIESLRPPAQAALIAELTTELAAQQSAAVGTGTRVETATAARDRVEGSVGRVRIAQYLRLTAVVRPRPSEDNRRDAARELARIESIMTPEEIAASALPDGDAAAQRARWQQLRAQVAVWWGTASATATASEAHDDDVEEIHLTQADLDLASASPVTVTVEASSYTAHFDGEGPGVALPVAAPGYNVDRPGGFQAGGSIAISDEIMSGAVASVFGPTTPDTSEDSPSARASAIVGTWEHNEGHADSINTWDRAILTFGPGLAAIGVLQSVFADLQRTNPDVFASLIGQYGIGVETSTGGSIFTVIVPRPAAGEVRPPGAPPPGTHLRDNLAEEYIANDPLLCAVMRHACATEEVQQCMARRAIMFSVEYAFGWELEVTPRHGRVEHQTVPWAEIMEGVDGSVVTGTYAAIADSRHGTGGARAIQALVAPRYHALVASEGVDPLAPNGAPRLSTAARTELARLTLSTVPGNRRGVFLTEISPTLFTGVPDATRAR